MEHFLTLDYMFSYWAFAWFLIYYNRRAFPQSTADFIKARLSPIIALWIALLFNTYEIVYSMFLKFDAILLIKFLLMMLCIKILPIYLFYRSGATTNWFNDILAFVFVFVLYNAYLYSRGAYISDVFAETERSLVSGDNKTPFFSLLASLEKLFKN
jgi:hypothetical protein